MAPSLFGGWLSRETAEKSFCGRDFMTVCDHVDIRHIPRVQAESPDSRFQYRFQQALRTALCGQRQYSSWKGGMRNKYLRVAEISKSGTKSPKVEPNHLTKSGTKSPPIYTNKGQMRGLKRVSGATQRCARLLRWFCSKCRVTPCTIARVRGSLRAHG